MPGPQVTQLPLVEAPAVWGLPRGIEARRGTPESSNREVIAFCNPRTRAATGVIADAVKQDKELPEWLLERVKKIA